MGDSQNEDVQATMATAANAGRAATADIGKGVERAVDAGQDAAQQGAEVLREGAQQMGAQAERVADRASAAMSIGVDYGRNMAEGLQIIAAEWFDSSRTLAERTFERMTALAQARNVVDLFGAQRDLITGSVQDMLAAQQRVGSASMTLITDAAQGATRRTAPLAA